MDTNTALSTILKFEASSDKPHTWAEMSQVLDACTILRIRPSQLVFERANEAYNAQPGLDHRLHIVPYGAGWRLIATLPGVAVDTGAFSSED